MRRAKRHILYALLAALFVLPAAGLTALSPAKKGASAAGDVNAEAALNEKLVVKYSMDDTSTGEGGKLAAYKWDMAAQDFVRNSAADATVRNRVDGKDWIPAGEVKSVSGLEGTGALSFTQRAHARASFNLPSNATGMTISMLVKNINTYWSSLIEFWDGTNGGRLGKGTMQGNGGRSKESDAWSSNCSAHTSATIAPGGGWDSFFIKHNNTNNDNGGAAVDPMVTDTWYQVTFVLTGGEMRAYRNGVLKQTFNQGNSGAIVSSIMTAVKSGNGMVGIRLGLDDNNGDILDDVRIYNGAFTEEEIQASLHPFIAAAPAYVDVEGLGYPADILLDGATSLSEAGGKKTGVTQRGVTYSYTPLTLGVNETTQANDDKGIKVTLSMNGQTQEVTVKFRRTLTLVAESLGYKLGDGPSVPIAIPADGSRDITVKVPAGTDLSNVKAGDIAVKKLDANSEAAKYKTQFVYNSKDHTAAVHFVYTGYELFDTIYTIKFAEMNTGLFTALSVTGGTHNVALQEGELNTHTRIFVADINHFSLTLTLDLCEGATLEGAEGNSKTFTASDLKDGMLSFKVISESGESAVYYLVPVTLSSDATLASLTAEGYELVKNGDDGYTVTVGRGESLKLLTALVATPNHAGAAVKLSYNESASTIILTVTATDGVASKTYTVQITEADIALSGILVDGAPLAGFDPTKTEYTVKYKGTEPAVTATAAAGAQVSVAKADGKAVITVTDSGASRVYTVNLIKMSSDAQLKKLTLSGTEVSFTGNNSATYTAPAGVRLSAIEVAAEVGEGASFKYTLSESESKIIITVTAEDGTVATYTVTVQMKAVSPAEGGKTEDNSPSSKGCSSAIGGAAASVLALFALAGAVVGCTVRTNKKRDARRTQDEENR